MSESSGVARTRAVSCLTRSRHCTIAAAALALTAATPSAFGQTIELDASVTAVALFPDDDRIGEDRTASFDLTLERATTRGRWFAYVEANTSPNRRQASTVLAEVNADAGTALDPDRRGRVQLSELNYQLALTDGASVTLGYLDPSGYLDRSRITNDENVQFLGVSFVNNPTIEFPDYTMGVVYQRPARGKQPQINAVVTSSNGLADNPNLSYAQLLELSSGNKGVFAAIGTAWLNERGLVRIGAWINTRPHTTLDETSNDSDNYGVYAVLGREWGNLGANLRLGMA
ncbi:MAG: hypothetical protein R3305_10830, partial [Gammaproteobacteria bacterium]|nr:hypothetical protein [Gammaproteobacteria bacterium]